MTEQEATQAVGSIISYRTQLLEASPLVCRLSEHLNISVASLLSKICYKKGNRRDKTRLFRDQKLRAKIAKRDSNKCFHCHQEIAEGDLHIDHLIPWSFGGKTNAYNGVASCSHCNESRGNKLNY